MKKRLSGILVGAILCVVGTALAAKAEIYTFYFDVWTQRQVSGPDRAWFMAQVEDTALRGPDAITSLTVTAPDGTVFDMTDNSWLDFQKMFINSYSADMFTSLTIPAGKYTARVVDKSATPKTLTNFDTLPATFLEPPGITAPLEGAALSSLTPTFRWRAVAGAQSYLVMLFNTTMGEPVYWRMENKHETYRNYFSVPRGDLKPGSQYRLQIEARDNDKNLGRRSRSLWVNFSTAP